MDEMEVLSEYIGIAVQDLWSSYFKDSLCKHAIYNAHIRRELKGVYSNFDQDWAQEMSELLAEYKKYADKKRELKNEITEQEIRTLKQK